MTAAPRWWKATAAASAGDPPAAATTAPRAIGWCGPPGVADTAATPTLGQTRPAARSELTAEAATGRAQVRRHHPGGVLVVEFAGDRGEIGGAGAGVRGEGGVDPSGGGEPPVQVALERGDVDHVADGDRGFDAGRVGVAARREPAVDEEHQCAVHPGSEQEVALRHRQHGRRAAR